MVPGTVGVPASNASCATCGCTTAFAHAADGSLLDALLTQPFGAVLAMTCAMLTLIGGWALWSGMPLSPLGEALLHPRHALGWVVLLLGAWGYKAGLALLAG